MNTKKSVNPFLLLHRGILKASIHSTQNPRMLYSRNARVGRYSINICGIN